MQILLFLRFVATGAHLALIGDHLGVSESATGRACRKVCRAILEDFLLCYPLPRQRKIPAGTRGFQENRWYVFLFNFYEYIASHRQYLQCFYLASFQRPCQMLTISDFDYAPLTVLQIATRSAKKLRKKR